jgi:hypothetical protein
MNMARFRLEGDPVKSDELRRFRFQLIWHTTPRPQTAEN